MPNNTLRLRRHFFIVALCACISICFGFTQCLSEADNSKVNENLKKALDQAHMKSKPPKKKYRIERPGNDFGIFQPIFEEIMNEIFEDILSDSKNDDKEPQEKESVKEFIYSQNGKHPFYSNVPIFQAMDGQVKDTPSGKMLSFYLEVGFSGEKFVVSNGNGEVIAKPKEFNPQIESASVFVSSDLGKTWREIPMNLKDKWGIIGPYRESWVAGAPLQEISPDGALPILYMFRAQSNSGSVAMELPVTNPGWLPNVEQFFPAVQTSTVIDESEAAPEYFDRYGSLKLTHSFIAFDGTNLYLSFQTTGGIFPFSIKSQDSHVSEFRSENDAGITPFIYAMKFASMAQDQSDGFSIGKWHLYAPLFGCIATPFNLIEFNKFYPQIRHVCRNKQSPTDTGDIKIGISEHGFLSRIPLSQICPDKCNSLRVVIGAMDYYSLNHLVDNQFLPTFHVYFRTHAIGKEVDEALSGTARGLDPPTQFVPEQGQVRVDNWILWPENAPNVEAMKSAYEKYLSTPGATF